MASERREQSAAYDPDESPFAAPPIEGLPFPKDSEEARAIRRVIEEAEREEAQRSGG